MTTQIVNNEGNASNAVLVGLSIRTWAANSMDKVVSEQVASEHGTDRKLGRFWKTLVPKHKGTPLGSIYAIEREARNFHYENTLPWMHDGVRILPVENFARYSAKMREFKSNLEKHVVSFLSQFDTIKEQAKNELKSMYCEEDYPSRDRLARAFSLDYNVMPLPKASTFFETKLSDVEVERAKQMLEADMQATFKRANDELWDRLYQCVARLQERLNGDKGYLRETVIDSAKDLLELLPRLNVNNDGKLEELRSQLQSSFSGLTAEALREDEVLRNQKATEVSAIESLMSSFMGNPVAKRSDKLECKNVA